MKSRCAMAILIGEKNIPSFLQSSWTEWNGYLYTEIYGEKGIITLDNRGNSDKVTVKYKESNKIEIYDYSTEPKSSFKDEVDHFIKCIQTNKQPQPTGYDGMRAVQIIEGIYKSSKTALKVKVLTDHDIKLKKLLEKKLLI